MPTVTERFAAFAAEYHSNTPPAEVFDHAKLCILDALGIVLSQASGSMEFLNDDASTKRMHPDLAALCGGTAANLAGHGCSGPCAAIEGRFGLFNSVLGSGHAIEVETLGSELGRVWQTLEIAFKPYPACHFNHGFADCALALKRAHGIEAKYTDNALQVINVGCASDIARAVDNLDSAPNLGELVAALNAASAAMRGG